MADVKAVANFFLYLAEEQAKQETGDMMTDLKLQKMLYFAQSWHLARHGRPLFENVIEAWDHGPVVPDAYAMYRQYGRNPIPAVAVNYRAFTASEMDTMMDVFAYYNQYSASGLRELSHVDGSPWADVYRPGQRHAIISTQSMEAYCKALPPLETPLDRAIRAGRVQIITPPISSNGHPILPAEDFEDWGDWDDA